MEYLLLLSSLETRPNTKSQIEVDVGGRGGGGVDVGNSGILFFISFFFFILPSFLEGADVRGGNITGH